MRIDLNVPFSEKDQAKALGAKYDPGSKSWFCPDGINPSKFERWLPKLPVVNLRAMNGFHLARIGEMCWRCRQPTYVYGVYFQHQPIMIEGHEMVDGEVEEIHGHSHYGPGFISNTTWFSAEAAKAIASNAPLLRLDNSATANSRYYMNHCMRCDAKIGDFELFSEPEGAFYPVDDKHARSIELKFIAVWLEAEMGGYHSHELPEPGKVRW